MKLEIKDSQNYAATIIQEPKPHKLLNSDRLYGITVFGMTAVVNEAWQDKEGDLAVFFPAECQISDAFASYANLYRHSEKNLDPGEVGYLEDSRRVRALKLRGNVSNGLILPVYILEMFVGEAKCFAEGDTFDTIDGVEICRKYRVKEAPVKTPREGGKLVKAFKRVDEKMLPEHIETDQWLRNEGLVEDGDMMVVTQKLHGTSVRLANTIVKRKLTLLERIAKRLGAKVAETEFDYIAGSRKVIKDPKSTTQDHFYSTDLWTKKLKEVQDLIPRNFILYGEMVGFTEGGTPIQKGHTYEAAPGESDLYVYRVAMVNDQGQLYDLSWDQVVQFCLARGLRYTPELWRGLKIDFELSDFEEKNFHAVESADRNMRRFGEYVEMPVKLSEGGAGADEGIVIRVDRGQPVPLLLKFKNPSHYLYETEVLDSGAVDTESDES